MKKISYILQFNAFMDKRFDDELSPAASLLYMIIFSDSTGCIGGMNGYTSAPECLPSRWATILTVLFPAI